ncbi:MAG: SpoIIE family protein phosphatase [Leptospira sp.]|nr:SpoIIE family protein phosphatase [Leptospira sp.]
MKESKSLLIPSLAFYRLNLLLGGLLSPIVLFIADYLNDDLPKAFQFFILFAIFSMAFYLLTYISDSFVRHIRKVFILTGLVTSYLFLFISYEYDFYYASLVAQILIVISITFVIVNIKELILFLAFYWTFDILLIVLYKDFILFDRAYQQEFFHFHVLLLVAMGICYIAMVSRSSQAQKFQEIIQSKELAMEFIQESRREVDDMRLALNASSIVAITNLRGVITYANGNFERISGYSLEELLGNTHRIINSGYHPPEFFRNVWKTISEGKVWIGEIKNKRKDGSYYWVATTIVPLSDNQGRPNRYIAIRNDITNRKLAEQKLILSEERFRNLYQNIKEDIQLAAETQKYLLPRIQDIPGFQWKAFVLPFMDVSGDLISLRKNKNDSYDIFLADIAGHGVASALISAVVALSFQQMDDLKDKDEVKTSHSLLAIRNAIQAIQIDEFICGVFLNLEVESKVLSYTYAGQLPGLLHRNGETKILEGRGMPLFPSGNILLNDYSIQLESGDQLLFFSDGVYEIKNNNEEFLDYEGFQQIAHSAFLQKESHPITFIENALMEFSLNSPLDDISMFYLYSE